MKRTLAKLLFISILVSTSFAVFSNVLQQSSKQNNAVTAPIFQLFEGMREHDQNKILAQFTKHALLQRINSKGEISNTDVKDFALSISKNTGKLDEHLLAVTIHQQNELASVWTPFAFYLNDNLSHCGSNSFQLVKLNDEWKIHYLIDVAYDGDCLAFVEEYKNK